MSRLTNFVFTINNPLMEAIEFNPERMHYLVYQREISESGTPHFQGYCELKTATRFNGIRILLGSDSVHIEQRRGTSREASDYCQKDDTRAPGYVPHVFGEMKETNPGARNDIAAFRDAVVSGKRKRDVEEEFPGILCRYPRYYDTLRGLTRPTREHELEVILLIGPPGCGKTRAVYHKFANVQDELWEMPISGTTLWFDTYDLHKYVLLDDFAGAVNHFTLTSLLKILDRYPVQVPVKGAHVWWMPNKIYITTNIYPRAWYKWDDREVQYAALARRITRVYDFYRHRADQLDPPVGEAPPHGHPVSTTGESWMKEERPTAIAEW